MYRIHDIYMKIIEDIDNSELKSLSGKASHTHTEPHTHAQLSLNVLIASVL